MSVWRKRATLPRDKRFSPWGRFKVRASTFREERSGVAAVEFGLLAFWFFLILFAIIETAFVFIGEMTLDQATARAARMVRTGQVSAAGWDKAAFKEHICDEITLLLSCDKIIVDLRSYSSFKDIPIGAPIVDRVLNAGGFGYEVGTRGQIMALRTFYEWPLYADIFRKYLSDLNSGSHLLMSVVIFQTEPF